MPEPTPRPHPHPLQALAWRAFAATNTLFASIVLTKGKGSEEPRKAAVESRECAVQTEVNDDGLWNKADGWPLEPSKCVIARLLWRVGWHR